MVPARNSQAVRGAAVDSEFSSPCESAPGNPRLVMEETADRPPPANHAPQISPNDVLNPDSRKPKFLSPSLLRNPEAARGRGSSHDPRQQYSPNSPSYTHSFSYFHSTGSGPFEAQFWLVERAHATLLRKLGPTGGRGMPPAILENAAMSMSQNSVQREYEGSVPMTKNGLSTKAPPVDDDTVSFRKQTRTWNYVWRSGVAGGLAGCAVRRVLQDQGLWTTQRYMY